MARGPRLAATVALLAAAIAVSTRIATPAADAAPQQSGTAEKVSQSAQASGESGARTLETEAAVYMNDQIRTNSSGEAQIRLLDDTHLVVGPDARLTIDKFVFNGRSAETVTLSVVRGAFRFITGNSAKRAYLLKTPVMTIGVRGTGLDGFVETGTGRTTIAIYEGAAELCDSGGQCQIFQQTCGVTIPPGGGFQEPTPGTRALLFPFAGSQSSLLPEFRLNVGPCRTSSAADAPESDNNGGGGSRSGGRSGQSEEGGD
jgi:hypothetical protein